MGEPSSRLNTQALVRCAGPTPTAFGLGFLQPLSTPSSRVEIDGPNLLADVRGGGSVNGYALEETPDA